NQCISTVAAVVLSVAAAGCGGGSTTNASNPNTPAQATVPSITTQPTNQSVTLGQPATFTVVATGTTPLQYQWRKNATAIAAATSASYTTPATTAADNGTMFDVVVSNSAGSVTSTPASLTVNSTPPPASGVDVVT